LELQGRITTTALHNAEANIRCIKLLLLGDA
jgi:hypothetical protein